MDKVIPIEVKESDAVQTLFTSYNSYIDLITILSQNGINKDVLNDQFEKAKDVSTKLSMLKEALRYKYQPKDEDFNNYSFDFHNHTMVFQR